jgi:hypothetical protein
MLVADPSGDQRSHPKSVSSRAPSVASDQHQGIGRNLPSPYRPNPATLIQVHGTVSLNAARRLCDSDGRGEGGEEAMNGSGGVGFVIDTATLFLFLVGISVLAGIWFWLRKKGTTKP